MTPELAAPKQRDIVLVVPGLWASGGYRTLYQWANRLIQAGCRVRVVAHCGGPGAQLLDPQVETLIPSRMRYLGRSPLRLVSHRLLHDRTQLPVTPAAVLDLLPKDGAVLTCWAPWVAEVARRRPTALYAQHWEPVWYGEGTPLRARTEAAMAAARPTLVNSTWLRNHFTPARQSDLQLVFPGVDHAVFAPADARPRMTIDGPLRVAALGRTEPLKGLAELRAAVQRLAEDGCPVELNLFGTTAKYVHHAGQVTERGLGNVTSSELATLYRSCDVVVTPSWYESFPLPPLEAMACGVPVITTRPGTEDYAVDGQTSLVVEPQDVAALTEALHRVASDAPLRRLLAEGGVEGARRFSWDAGYAMFVSALDAALDHVR